MAETAWCLKCARAVEDTYLCCSIGNKPGEAVVGYCLSHCPSHKENWMIKRWLDNHPTPEEPDDGPS